MKRKFTKQIKEDGVTVKLPMDTEGHMVDYDERDDDFIVKCTDADAINTGEIVGRYYTFFDAWMDAKFFDKDSTR